MKNNVWTETVVVAITLMAAVGLAQAAGMSKMDDQAITQQVVRKINEDDQLASQNIMVDTRDGEVTLKGRVSSQADVTRAGKLAGYVSGVRHVDNELSTMSAEQYKKTFPKPNCQIGANWEC